MFELLMGGSALAAGFLLLIAIVALTASLHPNKDVRADARKVLDRLLKFVRPFGLRDVGDHPPTHGHPVGGDRGSKAISGPSTGDARTDGPHPPTSNNAE